MDRSRAMKTGRWMDDGGGRTDALIKRKEGWMDVGGRKAGVDRGKESWK